MRRGLTTHSSSLFPSLLHFPHLPPPPLLFSLHLPLPPPLPSPSPPPFLPPPPPPPLPPPPPPLPPPSPPPPPPPPLPPPSPPPPPPPPPPSPPLPPPSPPPPPPPPPPPSPPPPLPPPPSHLYGVDFERLIVGEDFLDHFPQGGLHVLLSWAPPAKSSTWKTHTPYPMHSTPPFPYAQFPIPIHSIPHSHTLKTISHTLKLPFPIHSCTYVYLQYVVIILVMAVLARIKLFTSVAS